MAWPIQARRTSFDLLNFGGSFGYSGFGVNKAIENAYNDLAKRDISFEFFISSPSIHIAHALNSTYFPVINKGGFSEYFYATVMGEMLNLYKHFTEGSARAYVDSKKRISTGVLPISPIDIIEVNDFITIDELEQGLSKERIFPSSKRLMETLSALSEEERHRKIAFYNLEVKEKIRKRIGNGTIELGENIALDAAGALTGVPVLGSLWSLIKMGGNKLTKSMPVLKGVLEKVENTLHDSNVDQANIHFLSKINRVAKLKDRSL